MKVTLNKKLFKVIVGIIIAVAIVVAGVFVSKVVSTNIEIKETEEKLSQINAEELQAKIIKELESSKLNVNTTTSSTEFRTLIFNKSNFDTYIGATYEITDKYYGKGGKGNDKPLKDYISAFIIDKEDTSGVAIPCFKIESYDNGKFKNITYLEIGSPESISGIVGEAVKKVLKNEYGVNIIIEGNYKYNLHFRKASDILEPKIYNEEYWRNINNLITEENSTHIPKLATITFGLDINN